MSRSAHWIRPFSSRSWGLLAELKRETGLAILVHQPSNLAVVRQLCERRVLVLYLGSMLELAPAADILTTHSRHPYMSREELRWILRPSPIPTFSRDRLASVRSAASLLRRRFRRRAGCVYRTKLSICNGRV